MTLRRAIYTWTGYWSFAPEYLKEEPLDPPNIFVQIDDLAAGADRPVARISDRLVCWRFVLPLCWRAFPRPTIFRILKPTTCGP